MIHNFNLKVEPFESIKNHHKNVEMRTYDERRKILNVGDFITSQTSLFRLSA